MAIAFVFARYLRLTQRVSVPLLVGYQTRQKVADPRSRKIFDFRRLGADLVHDEVLLPQSGDPPLGLHDPVALATAGDRAETRRVRTWHRTRYPQGGLLLTQALPPDLELHLDEAIDSFGGSRCRSVDRSTCRSTLRSTIPLCGRAAHTSATDTRTSSSIYANCRAWASVAKRCAT